MQPSSLILDINQTTARLLLEIEAVYLRPQQPFILTSGRASPVYVDCRKVIAFPRARRKITEMAVQLIAEKIGLESLDVIAGGETAGIPYAAWIADALSLPMAYIRKQPKGFGRQSQIEGVIRPGNRCLLVEDLATDGRSKVNFIEALKAVEANIQHTLVVFHYGIFPESRSVLANLHVQLHELATWWDILAVAEKDGRLVGEDSKIVRAFLENPEGWKAANNSKIPPK
ncbi:MAG TPA: orotate phosphoribosyltransferase [Alphaproteobacteria bacterium]|nr:orotate phosphoribosyltransferase [Alphaproteobacteria bacterium]